MIVFFVIPIIQVPDSSSCDWNLWDVKENLQALGFNEPKSGQIIRSVQKRALIGSMKICKIVLKM